jgi:hypothetical protein
VAHPPNRWRPLPRQVAQVTPLFHCPFCQRFLVYERVRLGTISTLVCRRGCAVFRYHHGRHVLRRDARQNEMAVNS